MNKTLAERTFTDPRPFLTSRLETRETWFYCSNQGVSVYDIHYLGFSFDITSSSIISRVSRGASSRPR